MRHNRIPLYLFVSFLLLSLVTFSLDVSKQTVVVVSVSALIYTIAQTLQNYLNLFDDDIKAQIDTYNTTLKAGLDTPTLIFMKRYAHWLCSPKKVKVVNAIIAALECIAITVLVLGLIIPIPILENEKISTFASIFSFALLFLSIYFVEKYSERKSLWEELQLFSVALPQNGTTENKDEAADDKLITSTNDGEQD